MTTDSCNFWLLLEQARRVGGQSAPAAIAGATPGVGMAGAKMGPAYFRRPQSDSGSTQAVFFNFCGAVFTAGFFVNRVFSFAANSCLTFAAMASTSTL